MIGRTCETGKVSVFPQSAYSTFTVDWETFRTRALYQRPLPEKIKTSRIRWIIMRTKMFSFIVSQEFLSTLVYSKGHLTRQKPTEEQEKSFWLQYLYWLKCFFQNFAQITQIRFLLRYSFGTSTHHIASSFICFPTHSFSICLMFSI